ncbi:hypothetical protein [Dyadobacter frigoris]|uniref:hypothetical protein n=1 Tax=Dyadobacter frigoris TaxID=2576211 RepID=UPI001484FF6B|nr:hypothetical protein [Dyadobacter frigoris]
MKTLFFLTILTLSFLNCSDGEKTQIPTDFEVTIWEEDFGQVQLMAGTLNRDVDGKPYMVKFSLTDKEKLKIYNSILSNGILKLEEDYDTKPNCQGMHQALYLMRIVNGSYSRNINVSDCDYGFIEKLQAEKYLRVIQSVLNIVEEKSEAKEIPKSDVIRF